MLNLTNTVCILTDTSVGKILALQPSHGHEWEGIMYGFKYEGLVYERTGFGLLSDTPHHSGTYLGRN
jgi:hypothetical protein